MSAANIKQYAGLKICQGSVILKTIPAKLKTANIIRKMAQIIFVNLQKNFIFYLQVFGLSSSSSSPK